jgi:hypothetical protein
LELLDTTRNVATEELNLAIVQERAIMAKQEATTSVLGEPLTAVAGIQTEMKKTMVKEGIVEIVAVRESAIKVYINDILNQLILFNFF